MKFIKMNFVKMNSVKINFVKINGSKEIKFNSFEDRIIELTKLKKKLKKLKHSNLIKFINQFTKLNMVNMNILIHFLCLIMI